MGFPLSQVLVILEMGNVFSYTPPIAEVDEKTCDEVVRKRARCGVCLKPKDFPRARIYCWVPRVQIPCHKTGEEPEPHK